jgi:hypothetical protein
MVETPHRCHLYREEIGRREFRVIVPRPRDGLTISTNSYHDTWHVLSEPGHIPALRRLFWALAYDRHEGTLALLAGTTLAPTPFDAAPSRPVIIACSDRTHLRHDDVAAILKRLRSRRFPDCTVKLRTFGLRHIDEADSGASRRWFREQDRGSRGRALRVDLMGGAIVFHGPSATLRVVAASLEGLEQPLPPGDMNYQYIGDDPRRRWPPPGEVQVFGDYRRMLTDARLARDHVEPLAQNACPMVRSERVCEERAQRSYERINTPRKARPDRARSTDRVS